MAKITVTRLQNLPHVCAKVEHWGFVSVAACDTFALHNLLWFIAVILFVSGFIAAAFDK